ncbi:MAG: FAD-dependent oxidoreductase [Bacteroidales bacterium]|nr:FAD-dependent oxidoreductase [Bacteroidales bacterium]
MSNRVVIVGGGWAGVAAAITARKAGAEVLVIEKTDLLLGAGNVGGIFRNNGRYTATEEMKALGAGDAYNIMDKCALHTNVEFPGHKHASFYDVGAIEHIVRKHLTEMGVELMLGTHVFDVDFAEGKIKAVVLDSKEKVEGDVFIETTGSSGPMGNCLRYGHGCSMCIQRCPTFGPRVSLTARCGMKDMVSHRQDGTPGVFSGACKIDKRSLAPEIAEQLERTGVVILKVPEQDINYDKLGQKACKQYALKEYSENVILLDTGEAKLMTSYYPIEKLRKIPGLEKAQYIDPYSAGKGNSIRYLSIARRDNSMKVDGISNLYCGGEKGAPFIGHTEAVVTGSLAGHNAVRFLKGAEALVLPDTLAVGDIISYSNANFKEKEQYGDRYTFAGGVFFERMKERNLYTTDVNSIANRVETAGLSGIFEKNL